MHHIIITMPVHPGLFHLVVFSCAWARIYYYFLVPADSRCLNTPASLLSESQVPKNIGAPKSCSPPARRLPPLSRNSALTLPPLLLRWSTPQGISRTTHIQNRPTPSSRTTSNLQAHLEFVLCLLPLPTWLPRSCRPTSVRWLTPGSPCSTSPRTSTGRSPAPSSTPTGSRPFLASRFFLHVCLRPTLKLLQAAGTHGGELHEVDIDTRITTNSLRRGGNTAAANAGVRRELRMGQARWKAPMGQMVDHYDEVGLERQLSVSYLLSDEAPFNGYDWS